MNASESKSLSIAAAFSVALSFSTLSTGATAADVSFEGKTIEILVNFAAGSGTDSAARLVAPYVAKYLPGKPTMIVANKAGGGGTAAIDFLIDSVSPDGYHIGYFAGVPYRWSLGMDRVPDGTGELPYVAARSINQVIIQRTDIGLSADTLPGFSDPLYLGINSPDNIAAVRIRLLMDALDVSQFEAIGGYTGQNKTIAAIRANEVNLANTNESVFGSSREALLADGILAPLGQMGEYRDGRIVAQAGFEDIPVLDEIWRTAMPDKVDTAAYRAWEAISIAMAINHVFVLPPGTPEEFVQVWSDAVLAAYKDPEYIANLAKLGIPEASIVGHEELAKRLASLKSTFADSAVHDVIRNAIARNMK